MAKAKKKPKPEPDSQPFSFSAWLVRTAMMIVAGVLILAVIAVLFAKTDGFRSIVEREVESQLGLRVSVGDSGLLWNGDVRLQNLRTSGDDTAQPCGVEIADIRLRLSPLNLVRRGEASALRRILLSECRVTFSPDEGGGFQPKSLNGVAEWLARWGGLAIPSTGDAARRTPPPLFHPAGSDEAEVGPGVTSANWRRTQITIQDAEMRWLNADGDAFVSVHGLDFTAVPVRFPTRDATHFHLMIRHIELADNAQVNDMDVELLRTGATYLVLNLEAVRHSAMAETPRATAVPVEAMPEKPTPREIQADRASRIRAELERAVADESAERQRVSP